MSTPVVHIVAGPNGAGKTTFVVRILQPVTHLAFVNADVIAAERWPDAQSERAYDASRAAEAQRQQLMARRTSFITETVFSHPSKVALTASAATLGYLVQLHVILISKEAAVRRVQYRVHRGGHAVPEEKIRERYDRLWGLIAQATTHVSRADFYDNSRADLPFRSVAAYEHGRAIREPAWPTWTPAPLRRQP